MYKKNEKKKYLCMYNNTFKRSNVISDLKDDYKKQVLNKKYKICGRIFRKRVMGKASFLELKDISGNIQLFLSEKVLIDYKNIITYLNLGDIIGVEGCLFETQTKEISLNINELIILSKNINPFPDKRFGLSDREIRYRQRYLDLIMNDEIKNLFIIRSKIISDIRNFFIQKQYIEVETPIIQCITGGADAKPFETYHNYMDAKLYLRISPELYLKRLVVGGLEKVFEIGKNFRNENLSNRHHPEFTAIEFYEAYSNYKDLIKITENLFNTLAKSIFNSSQFIDENNHIQDFSKEFEQINFHDAIMKYTNLTNNELNSTNLLKNILKNENIIIDDYNNLSKLQTKIFEHFVEKNLITPTFIMHHPVEISPLSRQCDENSNLVERFELYINGKEIANGFSELNDPEEQEKRFKEQIKNKNQDIKYDEDYVNALKYALPPTAGEGIGIDRLVMLFTKSTSIKDVILFPLMKIK
ncbi:MAG TPA: lysine--tRNA ligase [Candidatus Azoamicus sp. MARI]